MPSKETLAGYLANLIAIMESKESAGIGRGQTLGNEYQRAYKEFVTKLKEEHDETR